MVARSRPPGGSDNDGTNGDVIQFGAIRLDSQSAARWYLERGYRIVPVPAGQKGPTLRNWQRTVFDLTNYTTYWPSNVQTNTGVLMGGDEGRTDADLDCTEALHLADYFLPHTGSMFGRASKPKSHRIYKVPDATSLNKATEPFKDETGGMIIELRIGQGGRAAQTVFPWSIHPSGEHIEWDANGRGEESSVAWAELRKAASRVAAATLVVRSWPVQGGRHEAALAMGAFMARAGLTVDEAVTFITAVCHECGDTELNDRVTAVRNSFTNHENGEQTYGMPKLIEIAGNDRAKLIAKYLGYEEVQSDELLEKLNATYCVLAISGGSPRVFEWQEIENGVFKPMFYRFSDFRDLNNHQKVGRTGLGTWWLGQAKRRQHRSIVFRPGLPSIISNGLGQDLNLWRGFAVEPQRGDWSLMHDHIQVVLANSESDMAEYIIKWAAWAFQHPGERAEVALVFKGPEGSGKGMFARAMRSIFGRHGKQISDAKHLTGSFNAHLMDCALLFADEAFWPGDKSGEGPLKRLLTEDTLLIEPKGVDAFETPNAMKVIMATNHDWVVPASINSRRFAVAETSHERMQDEVYFAALDDQMKAGGLGAMLYDLQNMDLGTWHPRRAIPRTNALYEQRLRSAAPIMKWWIELLQSGEVPGLVNGNEFSLQLLYDDAVRTTPALSRTSHGEFGAFLRSVGCIRNRRRHTGSGERPRFWQLPTLAHARAEAAAFGLTDYTDRDVWAVQVETI